MTRLRPTGLERTAAETHARMWWQSRASVAGRAAPLPALVTEDDLGLIAWFARRAYGRPQAPYGP